MTNFFLRVEIGRAETSPHILKMGNSFQMIGIAAGSNAAEMVNLQTVRDLSLGAFKSETVDINRFVFVLDDAIAFSILKS